MSGRHRNRIRKSPLPGIALALVVFLGVSIGIFAIYRLASQAGCSGQTQLKVAAAPEIANSVRESAQALAQRRAKTEGTCLGFEVVAADPADIASAIADQHGATLAGVGLPAGDIQVPDVWIPDSSTWLARVQQAVPGGELPDAPSIARSPVVVAMPEPIAATLGWPNAQLTWQALLQQVTTNSKLHIGTVDPARDATGLSGLLALGAAASGSPNGQSAATAALRTLAAGRSTLRQDLLARFPRSGDPAAIASGLSAAALSEQAVIAYNATRPPIKLAALFIEPAPVAMDYPYAVLSDTDSSKAAAAGALRSVLQENAFRERLALDGLRGSDGLPGSEFPALAGTPAPAVTPPPTAAQRSEVAAAVEKALSTWVAVTLPARMLAVIDVSGSMLQKVPTAGNATRAQVTVEAARRGLGLFDDSWAVGVWTFSTYLDGDKDYLQLAPIGPLSVQRSQLLAALNSIQPKPTGDTGLYDSLLAAYQAVQQDWDPGRVNSVVMLTDGDNDDPGGGLSHADLLAKLKEVADPQRPIQVIIIGIGPTVNSAPLEEITKQTGGGVFVAPDPAKIDEIFLKAISLRSAGVAR